MEHKIFVALSGAGLVAALIVGCSSASAAATAVPPKATFASPTTAPTATTARPSAPAQPTAAPTSVAPTTAAAPSANYDGEWKGKNSADSSLSFIVDNNQITYITVDYSSPAGTCGSESLSFTKVADNASIKGKDFSAQATFQSGDQITLVGSFKSNTEASGSFTIKSTGDTCGTFEVKGTFTAKNGGGVASAPMPSNPAPTGDSAAKTLRAFFDAINAKNVDAALALVDDTVTFNIASTTGVGKAALKTGNGAVTDDNNASFDDDGKIDFMVWK